MSGSEQRPPVPLDYRSGSEEKEVQEARFSRRLGAVAGCGCGAVLSLLAFVFLLFAAVTAMSAAWEAALCNLAAAFMVGFVAWVLLAWGVGSSSQDQA